jgi:hypothetical protein
MASRRDRPTGPADHEGLRALDGPVDDALEYSGPGGDGEDPMFPDQRLPGGLDHTTAAVGGGTLGLVLLGIAGAFKRRSIRRRYDTLDE